VTHVAHLGLFSRDASTSTVQSLLESSESAGYPFDSGMCHAPVRRDRLESVGMVPTFAQGVPLALGHCSMLPLLSIGAANRVPSSQAELQHVQYLRTQAFLRIQHQRKVIADLRTSLLGPSASFNGSLASVNHGSLNRNSPPDAGAGAGAIEIQGRSLHLSTTLATMEMPSSNAIPLSLPVIFAQPTDSFVLTEHQALLRQQIELFSATNDDLSSRIRGRNRKVELGQVGLRCRHCAHVPAAHRAKGSVYFPAQLLGLYQAAQNMSSNHIQCGLCPEMPQSLKDKFTQLFPTKAQSSGAGQSYWAESAKWLGMIDTDHGIRFVRDK
jgi:hypothetical protein